MSNPNRIPMIVGGVIGAVALAVCLLLPKDEQQDPNLQSTEPTGSGIHIQVPTGTTTPTDPDEIPPIIVIPGDEDPTDPTDPADPTKPSEGDPFVEDGEEDEETKVPGDEDEVVPDDEVTDIGKDDDEEQDVEQGEIRNESTIEDKEEAEAEKEEEIPDVVEVEEEVTEGEGKGDVHENEDQPNYDGDESNKNAPEYEESTGGDNPFDDDTETEIVDTPVEDLIGDGEDRPGEGDHF